MSGTVDTAGRAADLEDIVAISLLWADGSTQTARAFKAIVDEGGDAGLGCNGPASQGALERLVCEKFRDRAESAASVAEARVRARGALSLAAERGIECVPACTAAYPGLLWHIPDPPVVLWTVGDARAVSVPAVAIVGARQATPVGLSVARRLARGLAEAGLAVASGLARGVDGAAHEGALEAGGLTVAVLGFGADIIYPPEHRDLSRRIRQAGVLVTEFPPGAKPLPWRFPLRNRIISGLSRAVVVVEASERSGSLITARAALEQGRDVLAVPGSVASGRYRGAHALIKDGARLVETVDDVLEEIGWGRPAAPPVDGADKHIEISALEAIMATGEAYSLDDLAALTGRGVPDLLAELASLELAGRVARAEGGSFTKT